MALMKSDKQEYMHKKDFKYWYDVNVQLHKWVTVDQLALDGPRLIQQHKGDD